MRVEWCTESNYLLSARLTGNLNDVRLGISDIRVRISSDYRILRLVHGCVVCERELLRDCKLEVTRVSSTCFIESLRSLIKWTGQPSLSCNLCDMHPYEDHAERFFPCSPGINGDRLL